MSFLSENEWRNIDGCNGISFAKSFLAKGRYEIAEEFHRWGTAWYEKNVVGKRNRFDTKEDREVFREYLAEYKEFFKEFPLLIHTRNKMIEIVNSYPNGIERNQLKKMVDHPGITKFGVICNQLSRGGWLNQENIGKKFILKPAVQRPVTDDEFIKTTMQQIQANLANSKPIATLAVNNKGTREVRNKGTGCTTMLLLFLLLGCLVYLVRFWL